MGISRSKLKLVILDQQTIQQNYVQIIKSQTYKLVFYQNFDQFVEKQKLDLLQNVIVRYDNSNNQGNQDSQINLYDGNNQDNSNKIQSNVDEEMQSFVKLNNPFENICELFKAQLKSLKSQLIQYLKKYSIQLNIYLYVQDTTNIRLLQHQKPYIKLVSSSLGYIVSSIQNASGLNYGMMIKMERMFHGLYRRIMVKVVDKGYSEDGNVMSKEDTIQDIEMLKERGISYQYFSSVKTFQKSNISTACQYVICDDQTLVQLIDSKKLCEQSYNIIVRKEMKDFILTASDRKKKSIWAACSDLGIIIDKMKNCSQNSKDQAPQIAKNVIIIGNDEEYLDNIDEIQRQFKVNFKQQMKNKKIHVSFLNGDNLQPFFYQLKKDIYSFVVVFTCDEFLQRIKRQLRHKGFHHRVQLTNIPKQKNNFKQKIKYLCSEIKYQIKFQICPLYNIQVYKGSQMQVNFFNRRMGIKVQVINNFDEIVAENDEIEYKKILQSEHLVCKIKQYEQQIRQKLSYYEQKNKYYKKIKIIIMDIKKKIKKFIANPNNYSSNIAFIGYSLKNIQQFIKQCKCSTVSIPFFRKNVLSNFDDASKMFSVARKKWEVPFRVEVVCSNQVLALYLNKNIKFSTIYNIQFMIFSNYERGVQNSITFFQQQYIPMYTKLWFIGQNILRKHSKEDSYFETLKEQICLCFYKCKSYDLLKVTQQDFEVFYIRKIQQCRTFFQLQVSCIYILSLPHNFNEIINHLFKVPRKSKLSIKIFSIYLLVLFTTFYQFGKEQNKCQKLIVLIQQVNIKQKIQLLQKRDIVFSNSFIFCSDFQKCGGKLGKNSIVFVFQDIQFLQKSRIKNFLYIAKYSFYKQGAQYIIPPFTKFQVVEVKITGQGWYQIVLENVKNNGDNSRQSFMERVLQENQITEQILWERLKDQMEECMEENENKEVCNSLYREIQNRNLLENKLESVREFEKGIYYDEFFRCKNNQKYLSALVYLQSKIGEIQQQPNQKNSQSKLTTELQMLNTQHSYIYYKLSEYKLSLSYLYKLQQYLTQYIGQKSSQQLISNNWQQQTIQKFINGILSTYQNRKKLILGFTKKKYWKVSVKEGRIRGKVPQAHVKAMVLEWRVGYDQEFERFPMSCCKMLESSNKIQIMPNPNKYIPLKPQNQFGNIALNLINSNLYEIQQKILRIQKQEKKKIKSINKITNNKFKQHQQSSYKQQSQQIQNMYIIQKCLPVMEWKVFYLNNQVIVIQKHKHFHFKNSKIKNQKYLI